MTIDTIADRLVLDRLRSMQERLRHSGSADRIFTHDDARIAELEIDVRFLTGLLEFEYARRVEGLE